MSLELTASTIQRQVIEGPLFLQDSKTPGLASQASEVEDFISDPRGPWFSWELRNARPRLTAAMWHYKKGNDAFGEEGEGQGREPRAPGHSERTFAEPVRKVWLCVTVHRGRESVCAWLHPIRMVQKRQQAPGSPSWGTCNRLLHRGPVSSPDGRQIQGRRLSAGPHSPSLTSSRATGML